MNFKALHIKALSISKCAGLLVLTLGMWLQSEDAQSEVNLPLLGESSAGLISPAEEYAIGQKAIRYFRSVMPIHNDPFIEVYVEKVLTNLATYSELSDKRLELLIIDHKSLNAFAAPGGVVGVNTGTLLTAQYERHFVSILAHELAHLSQRHYARSQERQKHAAAKNLAGMLASLLIGVASSNPDAAIAGVMATQAGMIDSHLRFSRDMEREADRVGMDTLVRSGYDPHAMPEMFELMLRSTRYRTKPPEFLLTHPVTESRVSDAKLRSTKYPMRQTLEPKDYQLVRARAILNHEQNSSFAVKRFTAELEGNTLPSYAARYGLILAMTDNRQFAEAATHLKLLRNAIGPSDYVTAAEARIDAAQKNYDKAVRTLSKALTIEPNNHVLNVRLAEVLMKASRYDECQALLQAHVKRRPNNAYVWYLLAEVHGLAGNILEVHKARAEYFILHGIYEKAEIQLRNAIKLIKDNFHERAIVEQRLEDVKVLLADTKGLR